MHGVPHILWGVGAQGKPKSEARGIQRSRTASGSAATRTRQVRGGDHEARIAQRGERRPLYHEIACEPAVWSLMNSWLTSCAQRNMFSATRSCVSVWLKDWVTSWMNKGPSAKPFCRIKTGLVWRVQGWKLVFTGHSLGGGVAALLALRLKHRFPGVDKNSAG